MFSHKYRPLLRNILIFVSIPLITYLVVNKIYFGFFLKRVWSFKTLKHVKSIESIAPVRIEGKTATLTFHTLKNKNHQQYLQSQLDYSRESTFDASDELVDYLDRHNFKPIEKPLMDPKDLQKISVLFHDLRPQIDKEHDYMRYGGGVALVMRADDGSTIYAWDIGGVFAAGVDHHMNEIIFIKDNKVIESHFFYYDVAGYEGLQVVASVIALLLEISVVGMMLGYRLAKHGKKRNVGLLLFIVSLGFFVYLVQDNIWIFYVIGFYSFIFIVKSIMFGLHLVK